jgi:crotonobetainyl-CoA:carnitine CoA-transferase CaiB-like acyl-CoA transferase
MQIDDLNEIIHYKIKAKLEKLCKNKSICDYDVYPCVDETVLVVFYGDEDKEYEVTSNYIRRVK